MLLVNEITHVSDFATVTFGLTPGWWRPADPDRRLPHAPLLDPQRWDAAFRAAGLTPEEALHLPGDAPAQCVLVARREGAGESPLRCPAHPGQRTTTAEMCGATPRWQRGFGHDRPERRAVPTCRGIFADVLKYDEAELDADANFDVFGVDSLVSLNIVDRIQADLGEQPSTLLFEHIDLRALADHLS